MMKSFSFWSQSLSGSPSARPSARSPSLVGRVGRWTLSGDSSSGSTPASALHGASPFAPADNRCCEMIGRAEKHTKKKLSYRQNVKTPTKKHRSAAAAPQYQTAATCHSGATFGSFITNLGLALKENANDLNK